MKKDLIKDLRLTPDVSRSVDWYKKQIRNLGLNSLSGQSATKSEQLGKFATEITPGRMYLYCYDPKHKETLPYYDMFPLVFPFRETKDGFYGINLHYLPHLRRAEFLKKLQRYSTAGKTYTDKTKLRLSWNVLAQYADSFPCVKRYLTAHIRSRFLEIHAADWNTAALLPLEGFVGATINKVHRDSRSML